MGVLDAPHHTRSSEWAFTSRNDDGAEGTIGPGPGAYGAHPNFGTGHDGACG